MSDTGAADARLAAALRALATGPAAARRAEVLAALAGARVFAAVTPVRSQGPAGSTAEMALLTLVGTAGGRAVPLFLDAGAAVAFRAGSRPVPLRGSQACAAALDDGAVAVLLDPPGAALAVTGADLREVAQGRVPVGGAPLSAQRSTGALVAPGPADPALLHALGAALDGEPVRAARLLAHPDGPVLGVVPDGSLDAAGLAALAARVLPRVAEAALAVAVVPPQGPGTPVPLRRRRRLRPGR